MKLFWKTQGNKHKALQNSEAIKNMAHHLSAPF